MINLEQDLKSRYRALKLVLDFIDILKQQRNSGNPSKDEMLDIETYVNGLINNYIQLAKNVNNQIK